MSVVASATTMWRVTTVAVLVVVVASCGASTRHKTPRPAVVAHGCGTTRLYRGAVPAWTAPAFSDSSGSLAAPYALADDGNAVAVLFAYPLRAGHPTDPANKVLWIMRLPRHGSPLTIQARPLHGSRPTPRTSWPADSSPGEIYPSYVNVLERRLQQHRRMFPMGSSGERDAENASRVGDERDAIGPTGAGRLPCPYDRAACEWGNRWLLAPEGHTCPRRGRQEDFSHRDQAFSCASCQGPFRKRRCDGERSSPYDVSHVHVFGERHAGWSPVGRAERKADGWQFGQAATC